MVAREISYRFFRPALRHPRSAAIVVEKHKLTQANYPMKCA
jgi:hypothetical protein